ncbi:MAG: hypothetical protein ACRCZF_17270 [Gemmataceae bacterium]
MSHNVIWEESALQKLAELWLKASSPERLAMNRIVTDVDRILSDNPLELGESREQSSRIHFLGAYVIQFDIPDAGVVRVLSLHRIRSRPGSSSS